MLLHALVIVCSVWLIEGDKNRGPHPPNYYQPLPPGPPAPGPWQARPPGPWRGPPPPQPGGFPVCQNCQVPVPGNWTFPTIQPTIIVLPTGVFPTGLFTPTPDSTSSTGPPLSVPSGSLIFPNGTVRFPNSTVMMTRYASGAVPPAARLSSGSIMFANGTTLAAGTATTFPPPGIPLNGTAMPGYPPLFLPNNTLVFRNGTLWTPGLTKLSTIWVDGYLPSVLAG